MSKERKQDLSDPGEEALEQHVREMLDVNEPSTKKSTAITVKHDDDEPVAVIDDTAEASQSKEAAKPVEPVELAEPAATAPLLAKKSGKTLIPTTDEVSAPVNVPEAATAEPAPLEVEPEAIEAPLEIPGALLPEQPKKTTSSKQVVSSLDESINDPETDKAVRDIVAKESDELMAAQDRRLPTATIAAPKRKKKSLFKKSGFWWTLVFTVLLGSIAAGLYPTSRYYALNTVGIKSSSSITVTDKHSLKPVKNATVTIAGQSAQTNEEGVALVKNLPLGPANVTIEKRAYASETRALTIGWGSNPLEPIVLAPQGEQHIFMVKDFLSGAGITEAEATADGFQSVADRDGKIVFTLDEGVPDTLQVTINAPGYQQQLLQLDTTKTGNEQVIRLVPSKKLVYMEPGSTDIYTVLADGSDKKLVLKGTATETSDSVLAPHPTTDMLALLSTRNTERDAAGRLLPILNIVNVNSGELREVIKAPQLRLIDWVGSRLIYVYLQADSPTDDANRYKLMSYDITSGDNRQLASANYFNDIVSMSGSLYYAPGKAYQDGVNVGVFAVQADGSGKRSILDKESWSIMRTSHNGLTLSVEQQWYEYTAGQDKASELAGQLDTAGARIYVDNPGTTKSAFIDNVDGTPQVTLYDIQNKTEQAGPRAKNVIGPITWLNDSVYSYRLSGARSSELYVASTQGGEPIKVMTIANTNGLQKWAN